MDGGSDEKEEKNAGNQSTIYVLFSTGKFKKLSVLYIMCVSI
jgi:hypothetical protein